jgi:hypothetical protein
MAVRGEGDAAINEPAAMFGCLCPFFAPNGVRTRQFTEVPKIEVMHRNKNEPVHPQFIRVVEVQVMQQLNHISSSSIGWPWREAIESIWFC